MSKLWDAGCRERFVTQVGIILTEYHNRETAAEEAIKEIIYHYEDKIGEVDAGND